MGGCIGSAVTLDGYVSRASAAEVRLAVSQAGNTPCHDNQHVDVTAAFLLGFSFLFLYAVRHSLTWLEQQGRS